MYIQIKLGDELFFIAEDYYRLSSDGISFVKDIGKALNYDSIYDFKVAWKSLGLSLKTRRLESIDKNKEFYSVDNNTLELEKFDMNEKVSYDPNNTLKVSKEEFRKLIKCFYGSSHYMYDENDKWIAFPKKEDLDKIHYIKYYKRGLCSAIGAVYRDRKDPRGMASCYSFFQNRTFMLNNEEILKLYLDEDIGECDRIKVMIKEIK